MNHYKLNDIFNSKSYSIIKKLIKKKKSLQSIIELSIVFKCDVIVDYLIKNVKNFEMDYYSDGVSGQHMAHFGFEYTKKLLNAGVMYWPGKKFFFHKSPNEFPSPKLDEIFANNFKLVGYEFVFRDMTGYRRKGE